MRENTFMYGDYGDRVFLPQEAEWFAEEYVQVFQTSRGEAVEQLTIFARRH